MVDVGRQRGQLRFVSDGDLLAEILVAQGGDVLLHLTDVPDVLLEEKEEGRHEGSYEQHTADGLSQGGIGLIEIAAVSAHQDHTLWLSENLLFMGYIAE